jgi:hypothetical protein
VNADVRIADHGGESVGNVALGDAHVAKVPGHANDMDDVTIEMKRTNP